MIKKNTLIALTQCGKTLSINEGEYSTLLQALEAHQLTVEFQCREGYCGSCRVRIQKGAVHYQQTPLAFIHPGEILTCCCLPDGDIEIDL